MTSDEKKRTRVTLLDVAKHAEVSRATASLVIRKSPLVGSETRAKVEEVMRTLGYVYNVGAARLRAERSYIVGVIVPNLTNPFFAELLSGIESAIDTADMVVILANSGDQADRQDAILKRMREHGVDGIILCPAADTAPDLLQKIQNWNLPLVQVLRHISDDIDYVGVDYSGGMRQAVDYLASLQHQAIAFAVHGPVHSAYRERIDGFRMAMEARGLNPELIVRVPYQTSSIPESVHLIFDHAVKPTAVICFNDVIALALAAGLHDRGLSVGRNFSLVGFDDVVDAETMRPRLTSVSTVPVAIGGHAAGLIIDRLADRQGPPRRMISPAVLNVRQSCVALSVHAPE